MVTVEGHRLRVDRSIGEGGLSYVFAATDTQTGIVYALKCGTLPLWSASHHSSRRSLLPLNQRNSLLDERNLLVRISGLAQDLSFHAWNCLLGVHIRQYIECFSAAFPFATQAHHQDGVFPG